MNTNEPIKDQSMADVILSLPPEGRERMLLVRMLRDALSNAPGEIIKDSTSPMTHIVSDIGWRLPQRGDRVRVTKDPEKEFYSSSFIPGKELIASHPSCTTRKGSDVNTCSVFAMMCSDPDATEGSLLWCIPLECLEPVAK